MFSAKLYWLILNEVRVAIKMVVGNMSRKCFTKCCNAPKLQTFDFFAS